MRVSCRAMLKNRPSAGFRPAAGSLQPRTLTPFTSSSTIIRNSALAFLGPLAISGPPNSPQSATAHGSSQGVGTCGAAPDGTGGWSWAFSSFSAWPAACPTGRPSAKPPGRTPTPSLPTPRTCCRRCRSRPLPPPAVNSRKSSRPPGPRPSTPVRWRSACGPRSTRRRSSTTRCGRRWPSTSANSCRRPKGCVPKSSNRSTSGSYSD